jgi:hypothetical protein
MTIDRELIEDIESRLGMAAHNIGAMEEVNRSRIELEAVFKQWLTLRAKLQAAGVVSNVGG